MPSIPTARSFVERSGTTKLQVSRSIPRERRKRSLLPVPTSSPDSNAHMLTRVSAFALLILLGAAPHRVSQPAGTFRLHVPAGSYFAGSRVRIAAEGVSGPYSLVVLGPGTIDGDTFVAPQVSRGAWTTIIGASSAAVAYAAIRTVPAPTAAHVIAVATYRGGIALHDERTFATLGNFAIAGAPADVAFFPNGSFVTADTDGSTLTRIDRSTWSITNISGVDVGNDV